MKKAIWPLLVLFLASCGSQPEEGSPPVEACPVKEESAVQTAAVGRIIRDAVSRTRFIVKLSSDMEAATLDGNMRSMLMRSLPAGTAAEAIAPGFLKIATDGAMTVAELAGYLLPGDFEYIEPDYEVQNTLSANDEYLAKQWAHKAVKSSQAWDINRGSRDVVVAVLDSGVDYNHEDLSANMWRNPKEISNGKDDDGNGYVDDIYGWNFVKDNNKPLSDDKSNHGTHVAGTIGAVGNNGVGISGHSQRVRIMALKFLSSTGSGYTSDAIKGVHYAVENGAHIINNSWGGSNFSQSLYDAIERARKAGILFVAAAGNAGKNNDNSNFYPTNYPHSNIIRVAASTSSDKLASFSNYGVKKVDLAAPGSSIYSTANGNSYKTLSGTSMAAPLVSGVLATMVAQRPDFTYSQIKGILLKNVDVLSAFKGKVASGGRINAYRSLAALGSTTGGNPIPVPSPSQPPGQDPAPGAGCP